MSILTRPELLRRIQQDALIRDPNTDSSGQIRIEGSSYDLCVGSIIWKDSDTGDTKTYHYDFNKAPHNQEHVTLHPGQMLFVVTKEEINMPLDLCATVFSRNKLARDGILALNAGHVDPGYEGSIIIRLINLKASPYTLYLGVPIYTIVFQSLDLPIAAHLKHQPVTRAESILKATSSVNEALANALYDLALLNPFVKKSDVGDEVRRALTSIIKNFVYNTVRLVIKIVAWIVAVVAFIATVAGGWEPFVTLVEKYFSSH